MTRTEDNAELIDGICKQLNEHPYMYDVDIKAMALLDISKSLAIIADNLNKEDKNND